MKTPFLATPFIQSHPSNRLVARLLLSGMFLIAALTGSYQKSQSAPLEDPRVVVSQETPPKEPPASAILPFKLEVIEVPSSNMPGIHSYASGSANGKWLVLGGRTGGLHGFTNNKKDNFPRRTANTVAYVIDPIKNQLLGSVDLVANLPPGLAGPLTATNPEFVQVDSRLYILGGYGQDLPAETLTTFGTITMVDLPGLIGAITDGSTDIKSYFTQTPAPDNRLKVAGGVLKYYKGTFFLVFGQDFTGYYSVENRDYNRAGGQFQKYTEKVRVFTLNADLSIDKFSEIDGGYDESLPYHRRDLNVVDTILSDGSTPGATVYGGVFRAGRVAGHTMPIDIQLAPATPVVTVRTGFQQALCQYDCAYVPIFDSASSSTFTTLFGGISQYHYDPTRNILIQDEVDLSNGVDGLPFISTISTIQRQGVDGTFSQFIHPSPMPGLLGTDAQFLVSQTAVAAEQFFSNRVLNLSKLGGRTLIGHIVGGIESYGPYSGLVAQSPSTVSSTRLFEVWVTPGPDAFTVMPPLPKTLTKYVQPPKP